MFPPTDGVVSVRGAPSFALRDVWFVGNNATSLAMVLGAKPLVSFVGGGFAHNLATPVVLLAAGGVIRFDGVQWVNNTRASCVSRPLRSFCNH